MRKCLIRALISMLDTQCLNYEYIRLDMFKLQVTLVGVNEFERNIVRKFAKNSTKCLTASDIVKTSPRCKSLSLGLQILMLTSKECINDVH